MGPTLVLQDVLIHPGSSISELTARTGLPQSYASESVARLRDRGMVETSPDPTDGRRTLVRTSRKHLRNVNRKGAVSVDAALANALHEKDPSELQSILDSLSDLVERLRPSDPGRVAQQLKAARGGVT